MCGTHFISAFVIAWMSSMMACDHNPKVEIALSEIKSISTSDYQGTSQTEGKKITSKKSKALPEIDTLVNNYLTVTLTLLNVQNMPYRIAEPIMEKYALAGANFNSGSIAPKSFKVFLDPSGLFSLAFKDTVWADPLSELIDRRGHFPIISFRKGGAAMIILEDKIPQPPSPSLEPAPSAGKVVQNKVYRLEIENGSEARISDRIWSFENNKWTEKKK
ncbi:MAG: hypothetical protein WBW16_03335 [Bacteroidota bacterium]